MNTSHYKDEILNTLAQKANIAQFVSFSAGQNIEQRYSNISGEPPNDKSHSIEKVVELLISRSAEGKVNVRSFDPSQPKGHPFRYALTEVSEVINAIKENASANLFSIVNETIDINDGGVSGVALGNIIEFMPGNTPKGVDGPGVCRLPRELGLTILETVYGFLPEVDFGPNVRVEFSIHPLKRGIKQQHTIIWELETFEEVHDQKDIVIEWPNNFSKIIGDKSFGLLIADSIDLPVPKTTVISRKVAPFTFGTDTGQSEIWIRTAPVDRTPGKFSTFLGWHDPYKLLQSEDPNNDRIASILAQQSVNPVYSGSLLTKADYSPFIEGTKGRGDQFMVGEVEVSNIPVDVKEKISYLFDVALKKLGPIEMEWVFDGSTVWIVQMHIGRHLQLNESTIVEGNPNVFISFNVDEGLEELRNLISRIKASNENTGIKLLGNIGITSHMGDVLRKSKIPSIIQRV